MSKANAPNLQARNANIRIESIFCSPAAFATAGQNALAKDDESVCVCAETWFAIVIAALLAGPKFRLTTIAKP